MGRTIEAQFQWSHARDLKPEPYELAKIQEKLKSGLAEEPSSAADAGKQKKPGNGGSSGPLVSTPSRAGLHETAPAKVNLTLRVLGRRSDGYHKIESLVAFADESDRLSFVRGDVLKLVVRGFGRGAAGSISKNLVLKSARLLAAEIEV